MERRLSIYMDSLLVLRLVIMCFTYYYVFELTSVTKYLYM